MSNAARKARKRQNQLELSLVGKVHQPFQHPAKTPTPRRLKGSRRPLTFEQIEYITARVAAALTNGTWK